VVCFWKILKAEFLFMNDFLDFSRNTHLVSGKMGVGVKEFQVQILLLSPVTQMALLLTLRSSNFSSSE
jgi:hypothetical protein